MSGREHLIAVSAVDKGLVMELLRYAQEIRPAKAYFDDLPDLKLDKEMVTLASELIAKKAAPFTPERYKDSYADAVRAMIEEKAKGHRISVSPEAGARAEQCHRSYGGTEEEPQGRCTVSESHSSADRERAKAGTGEENHSQVWKSVGALHAKAGHSASPHYAGTHSGVHRRSRCRGFIPPIKPVLGQDVPDGPNWLHELKYDGYRMQAHVESGSVRMLSKNGLDWTARFGPITRALEDSPVELRHHRRRSDRSG